MVPIQVGSPVYPPLHSHAYALLMPAIELSPDTGVVPINIPSMYNVIEEFVRTLTIWCLAPTLTPGPVTPCSTLHGAVRLPQEMAVRLSLAEFLSGVTKYPFDPYPFSLPPK